MTPKQILEQADNCVKCGLCLPHCPTYGLTANEAESPRGRVALVQGLLSGALADSGRLQLHLDRCLGCGACEANCPSQVAVTDIIDGAKTVRMEQSPGLGRLLRKKLLDLGARPALPMGLLKTYQRIRLSPLLRASGLLRLMHLDRVEGFTPPDLALAGTIAGHYPASGTEIGRLALFPGCVGRFLDHRALAAALKLLPRLGYSVSVPAPNCCCGALHRHAGFAAEADRELAHTRTLFDGRGFDAVLVASSACAGEFQRQGGPKQVVEASRFLADLQWPAELSLESLDRQVLVHVPCTQGYLLRDPDAAFRLLERIPGLRMRALPGNNRCCGAAGTYMLRHPAWADALLAAKLGPLSDSGGAILATTNTGCALHMAAGVRQAGLDVEVCHPLELLARQLSGSARERLDLEGARRQNGAAS